MSQTDHRYFPYSQTKMTSAPQESDEAFTSEYNASEVRMILQELFPSRKLVLSQFTFFNQSGVGKPSGNTTRRGRRCYRLSDLLPIATILALKEQGIPNKNVDKAPPLVQDLADQIFSADGPCQLSGVGDLVHLSLPKQRILSAVTSSAVTSTEGVDLAVIALLDNATSDFFWSYDVGFLALELVRVTNRLLREGKFTSTENKTDSVHELSALNKRAVA